MHRRSFTAAAFLFAAFSPAWIALGQSTAVLDAPVASLPGQSLGLGSVNNLRDVGGYKTSDGQVVRSKRLYRSNQLGRISAADMTAIEGLGLKCDYDLRRESERTGAPDMLPSGVKNIWLNVMADSTGNSLPAIGALIRDPKEANETWGKGQMEDRYFNIYRQFITLPSANKAYKQFFTELAQEENLPAIVHCTAGKDRTGWAVAALLSLLGVPREVVFQDYLRSNDNLLKGYQRTIDSFAEAQGDPNVLNSMLGVKKEYLQTAFDEMQTKYGTIENYFAKGLEIDAAGQQALKDRFLAKP